jgi:hypothetical protein
MHEKRNKLQEAIANQETVSSEFWRLRKKRFSVEGEPRCTRGAAFNTFYPNCRSNQMARALFAQEKDEQAQTLWAEEAEALVRDPLCHSKVFHPDAS